MIRNEYRLIILATIFTLALFSCSLKNMQSYEPPKVLGYSTWEEWKEKTGWKENDNYILDKNKINKLKNLVNDNHKFVIFGTTFCDDCKDNIPKVIRILQELQVPKNNIRLYGLDYDLTEPSGYYKNFKIPSTPCVFILEADKVLGSIAHPDYDWLDNILKIIEKSQG
ncbi:MAG: hypothetical protein N2319_10290 [Candidatus Kapabacteria bacterium]|nr:hypothetical protein [Candidatus Kapabacteria bacterium]